MKTSIEAIQFLLDLLDQLGIEYMLVGSLSSNFYGVSALVRRARNDGDTGTGSPRCGGFGG